MSDFSLPPLGPAEARALVASRTPALVFQTELLDEKEDPLLAREGVLGWSPETRTWATAVLSKPPRPSQDVGKTLGVRHAGERHRTLPQALARLGAALSAPHEAQAGVRHRLIDVDPTYPGLPATSGHVFSALFPTPAGASLAQALEEAAGRPGVRTGGAADLEILAEGGGPGGAPILSVEGWPGPAELRRSPVLESWSPFGIFERRPTAEEAVGQVRLAAAIAQDVSGMTTDPALAGWSQWRLEGAPGREADAQGALLGGLLARLDERLADQDGADLVLRAGVRAARMAMERAPSDPRSLRAAGAVLHAQADRLPPGDAVVWSALGRLAEDLSAVRESSRSARGEDPAAR